MYEIECPCGSTDWFLPVRPDGQWECAECGERAYGEVKERILEWHYDRSLPDMTGYAEQ